MDLGVTEYNANLMNNPRFRTYMRQSTATSGQVPQSSALQAIVQEELANAQADAFRRKRLAYEKYKFDRQQAFQDRAFDANNEALESARYSNLGSGLFGLGTTALALYGRNKFGG